jgi:DNA-binding NarL/FixJ family response regulator
MDTPSNHKQSQRARVFVVEDHPIVREGLTLLISNDPGLMVCGCVDSMKDAMASMRQAKPDVVVLDITLGDGNGLELIRLLHREMPKVPVLVLSMHHEDLQAERALRAGAKGYVMKSEAMDTVRAGSHRVLKGEMFVSERMTSRMLERMVKLRTPEGPSRLETLSEREFDVFRMIAQGIGPTQIAQQLGLSVKTVETHREHIKEKLGLSNGAELTRFAVQWQTGHA